MVTFLYSFVYFFNKSFCISWCFYNHNIIQLGVMVGRMPRSHQLSQDHPLQCEQSSLDARTDVDLAMNLLTWFGSKRHYILHVLIVICHTTNVQFYNVIFYRLKISTKFSCQLLLYQLESFFTTTSTSNNRPKRCSLLPDNSLHTASGCINRFL